MPNTLVGDDGSQFEKVQKKEAENGVKAGQKPSNGGGPCLIVALTELGVALTAALLIRRGRRSK